MRPRLFQLLSCTLQQARAAQSLYTNCQLTRFTVRHDGTKRNSRQFVLLPHNHSASSLFTKSAQMCSINMLCPNAEWIGQLDKSEKDLFYASNVGLLHRAFRLQGNTNTIANVFTEEQLAFVSMRTATKCSKQEWDKLISVVKEMCLSKKKYHFEELPYIYMMYYFYVNNQPQLLIAFIKHLKQTDKLNQDLTLRSIYLLATYRERQQEFLLSLNKHLFERFDNSERAVDIFLLNSLLNTNYWKIGLQFIEILESLETNTKSHYACLIIGALRAGDLDTMFKMMAKVIQNKMEHGSTPASEQLTLAARHGVLSFEQLVDLIGKTGIIIPERTAKRVAELTTNMVPDWNIQVTNVDGEGKCLGCSETLQLETFEQQDIDNIRRGLLQNIPKYSEVSADLASLERKIIDYGPFDVVIDAENVFYNIDNKSDVSRLMPILNHFCVVKAMKVLVVSRRLYPANVTNFVSRFTDRVGFFTCSESGTDDFFVLYASVMNGFPTYIVSKDMYRDYALMMKSPNNSFVRWLSSQQVNPETFQNLYPFKINVQRSANSCHIPYQKAPFVAVSISFIKEIRILCLTRQHKS